MKRTYIILVLICGLLATQNIRANTLLLENDWSLEEYHKYKTQLIELNKAKKLSETFQAGDSTNSYDVLSYSIYMDWYNILHYGKDIAPEDKYWDARIQIGLKSNIDGLNTINLDAVDLEILKIDAGFGGISPTPQIINNILSIPLSEPLNKDEQTTIVIHYRYNNFENIGFNLYYKDTVVNQMKAEENIAYTVNSPEFARYWFPCNDTPRDKAALNMQVKVPYGYSVASNGNLQEVNHIQSETGDNYSIFTWADTTPIATFLINAVASKFEKYTEWFSPNPTATEPDSLEIINFVWENDLDGNIYSAKRSLRRTKDILEYFSTLFIDYPFCKYGTAEVHPFMYGAMENQTMTNLSKTIYKILYDGNTVAHEIAHHWFGNLVSAYNWNDIWFKEGAATWCEALWYYKQLNDQENAYLSTMRQQSKLYFSYPELYNIPIWGNSPDIFFSSPYVFLTYQKASWIYHQLHYHIGQEKNFDILKKLLSKYAYKNINDTDFIQVYREELENYPLDFNIDRFFKQWLYGAGHPIYNCQIVKTLENEIDSTWNIHITLTQTQEGSNIADVFETPIWMIFFKGNQEVYKERVLNNQKTQEYNFYNVPNFTSARVDSSRTLAQTPISNIVSIKHSDISKIFVYPNPAIQQKFVYIYGIDNVDYPFANDMISITNSFGIEQNCLINSLDTGVQIDISNLVNGIYFIRFGGTFLKFSVVW